MDNRFIRYQPRTKTMTKQETNMTIEELLEALPWRIKGSARVPEKHWMTKAELEILKLPSVSTTKWLVKYKEETNYQDNLLFYGVTFHEALMKAYIYLKENNFIQ